MQSTKSRHKPWTPEEDKMLAYYWGEHSLDNICEKLGRPIQGVYHRAKYKLKLGVGCPQGYEYLNQSIKRTGYSLRQIRTILKFYRTKALTTMSIGRGKQYRHHMIEPRVLDELIEKWQKRETLTHAARRHNVLVETMRFRLKRAGIDLPFRICLPSLDPDEVDAAMRLETASEASRRTGRHVTTLRTRLKLAGKHAGRCKHQLFPPEFWDELAAPTRVDYGALKDK